MYQVEVRCSSISWSELSLPFSTVTKILAVGYRANLNIQNWIGWLWWVFLNSVSFQKGFIIVIIYDCARSRLTINIKWLFIFIQDKKNDFREIICNNLSKKRLISRTYMVILIYRGTQNTKILCHFKFNSYRLHVSFLFTRYVISIDICSSFIITHCFRFFLQSKCKINHVNFLTL